VPYEFDCLKRFQSKPFLYKIDYHNKSYVARFNEDDWIDEINFHYYAQQEGFGPNLVYANKDDGLIIMEYFQNEEFVGDNINQIDLLLECLNKVHPGTFTCRPRESFF